PALARRRGLARAIGLSVGLIAVGILARVLDGSVTVLAGTFVACAGIAICNVLIPVVIKESYPHRIGLLTGLYTGTLQTAAALAAFLTPPLNAALGGWRPALGSWSGLAVLALFGWVLAARHGHAETTERPVARTEPVSALLRNPLAWFVTLFFGLQATFAYAVMGWMPQVLMGAGVSRGTAGVMMAMMSVLGAPLSLLVVPYVTRRRSQSGWIAGFTLVGSVGVLGLLIAPSAAPWL